MQTSSNRSGSNKNIKITLFFLDIITFFVIFVSIFILFEIIIKKILVDNKIDGFYDNVDYIQDDIFNSFQYLDERNELSYEQGSSKILNYIKLSALNRVKYDNSVVLFLFPEDYNLIIGGQRNTPDIEIDLKHYNYNYFKKLLEVIPEQFTKTEFENILNKIINVDDKELISQCYKPVGETFILNSPLDPYKTYKANIILSNIKVIKKQAKDIRFTMNGNSYIGVAQFFNTQIKSNFSRNSDSTFKPIIILADRNSEFFYLIDKVRNYFFLMLIIIFGTGFAIKFYNTYKITTEIFKISTNIKEDSDNIRINGEIGKSLINITPQFRETDILYNSYISLNDQLNDLGNIITGIADRDLFIATLKKDNSVLNPHKVLMTVMFLDIKGFTTISEKFKENALKIVNHIWNEVERIIVKFNGKINKYMGDASLIIFPENYTDSKEMSSNYALNAAINILNTVPIICKELDIDFNFRIGLDYGSVFYGKTGSENKYELGVIGDPVNTASRFEALNKQYGTNLLMSEKVLENTGLTYDTRISLQEDCNTNIRIYMLDKARPKGKTEAKEMFTVLTVKDDNQFSFIGSDKIFVDEQFSKFTDILKDFFAGIKYWQEITNPDSETTKQSLKEAAVNKWIELGKKFSHFYHTDKFPPAIHYVKILIKFEEFDHFTKNPDEWLKKDSFFIKEPSDDWIKFGAMELDK